MSNRIPATWHYVYRLINHCKKEVYHGKTINIEERFHIHCIGRTTSLRHWQCKVDDIEALILTKHRTQQKASQVAHNHEKTFSYKNYDIIKTRGQ